MKTREVLYANEAAELLRILSSYKALYTEQVYRLFPGRESMIRTLLFNLRQQKRIFGSRDGRILSALEDIEPDRSTIKTFWILLDFINRVEYHAPGIFPVALFFFLDSELYEVIYVPPSQEAMICHACGGNKEITGKRIVVVEETSQIEKISFSSISGFCTVSEAGKIQYFQRKQDTNG
ncbi:MAG: DUF5697 family protein [Oscillospiraceae bacterium]|nr:DUF5697 family protein [Oscillospiraceae bacterium]